MGDYLLVSRTEDGDTARALASELAGGARRAGLLVSDLNASTWLAVGGPHPPNTLQVSNWTLIGDVFDRRSPQIPATRPGDPWDYERKMMARLWGRFVGVQFGRGQKPVTLLRDPSGALECVAWDHEGLTIVSSVAFDWLIQRLRPAWRINVGRLAQALRDPLPSMGALLLDGPVALTPGTIQPLPLSHPAVEIWNPAVIARQSQDPWPSTEEASRHLRAVIDDTVSSLAGLSGPIAAEISGGLDSSIVASSIARRDPDTVKLWINAYGTTPESDERRYVAALGRKLGVEPACVPHAAAPITTEWLNAIAQDFRPGLNALDRPHDLDWTRRLTAAGAIGLMTGRGGDTILLQRATADAFIDRWRDEKWRSLWSPDVWELAAANEVSIWTLIGQARRRGRKVHTIPQRSHPMLPALPKTCSLHPWLRNWDDFGPAKAFQIAGLADSVSRHEPSALSRAVDVRNPLCAQPVIEACLALPASLLTTGGRERGLARHAFRNRLPAEIIERRSKGDMTRTYGRMIHDSLDVLRPWLIDGRLAALGVIDAAATDRELTRETLLWRGKYSTIILAAAFEAWVRTWEGLVGPTR
ncbi:asparagine synthase [Brevundimonas diminuta]|uniref:Asparagine synthase n=2 Tax=Brevundimonas diminuta TaxID=293 RepID=A0A410NYX6_BREDI|nr:asparagine synthase C-terminal domain-containing protein [Brevundimonas diminuta]EGF94507.1 asparagine synthase family protein [Brevundimonas diminuta ATCC 11568]MBD3572497.1 asparagine synthase [Brevundimonas diminuta]MBD3817824.1 asparagine synthase [Brevundimonas diminuta]OWR20526.1 asparagine synthase [Brevundimonas diminuta]QAT15011.1 asparagine synthase [Brevundimonas diminuta]